MRGQGAYGAADFLRGLSRDITVVLLMHMRLDLPTESDVDIFDVIYWGINF
jgi:hypothetical protein